MNKKIKIVISTLFIIALLLITNNVFAYEYRPTQFYPYYDSNGKKAYFCAERGGALRFWDESEILNSAGHVIRLEGQGVSINGQDIDPIVTTYKYNTEQESLDWFIGNVENGPGENYLINAVLKPKIALALRNITGDKRASIQFGGEWDKGFSKDEKSDEDILEDTTTNILSEQGGLYTSKKVAATPVYKTENTVTNKNNRLSYILSSGQEVPAEKNSHNVTTNYKKTVSDTYAQDLDVIQRALWQDTTTTNPNSSYVHNVGALPTPENQNKYDNVGLYAEAVAYESFYNDVSTNGYNPKFNNIVTSRTVNRSSEEYTVGPFSITYPDNSFSYIEDMYITNQDGTKSTTNFTIIKNSSDRTYPGNGEEFSIRFKASDLNYPTGIKVVVVFNYLETTYSKYTRITGSGNIYEYYAWAKIWSSDAVSEDSPARIEDTAFYTKNVEGNEGIKWSYTDPEKEEINNLTPTNITKGEVTKLCVGYYEYVKDTTVPYTVGKGYKYLKKECWYPYDKWLARAAWYVGIRATDLTYKPQEATYIEMEAGGYIKNIPEDTNDVTGANRQWKKVTITTPFTVDLRMKIQGKVWVENTFNKEGKVDGMYVSDPLNPNKDIEMKNIEVALYKGDNTYITSTTTSENGHYEFDNLSALSQYYVRFKYNGQYYEPTYYTNPTSYSQGWQNTSNGTDYQGNYVVNENFEGRLKYNEKFATINSSTSNYMVGNRYNETFTKEQLLGYTIEQINSYTDKNQLLKQTPKGTPVIDEFGNLILQTSTDATISKMIQFVKDCEMYSWTKSIEDAMDLYPNNNVFTINNSREVVNDKSQHINQGYKERQEVDLSLKNDVHHVTIEINGKTQEYKYDTRANAENADNTWDIGVRLADAYYSTNYSREVYPSDYEFRVANYGSSAAELGKTAEKDELKVYITYLVQVINNSMSIRTKIDEIVDYYDTDYKYVADRSYIQIVTGNNMGKYAINATGESRYKDIPNTNTTIEGYNNLYIKGLDNIYLTSGQMAYVYITFEVNKDGNGYIKLDENVQNGTTIGVGKENIAEINGYSTLYKDGTKIPNVTSKLENGEEVLTKTEVDKKAGLLDVDSNPGNLKATYVPKDGTIQFNRFEDDTDKAPNIRIILNTNSSRTLTGYVWEDNRNVVNNSQGTATGNGIREEGETLINGVTVQLVEIINDNGVQKEYVWREFGSDITGTGSIGKGTGSGTKTEEKPIINLNNLVKNYKFEGNKNGAYVFHSYIPGDYIVRFIYGDSERTVLTTSSEVTSVLGKAGLNAKSYNGHDYKSTKYQADLGTYDGDGKNYSKQYNYDIAKGDTALVSDAKDLYNVRTSVNNYSKGERKNAFAEELASYMSVPEYNGTKYDNSKMTGLLNSFIANTKMTAETGIINMEVEYNRTTTPNQTINNKNPYNLNNLDLGLEERPKAQIEVIKDVKNLKITLSNGNILFDSTNGTDNLGWLECPEYYSYENNLMTPSRYGSIENIRNNRTFGLVQPTLDKEIMHGATLEIKYEIKVINTGEVDYEEEQFYYTGIAKNPNNPVTTNAIQLVDYIPNNLKYDGTQNGSNWQKIETKDLVETNKLVNAKLESNLNKFENIITTTKTNTALVPVIYTQKVNSSRNSSVSVPLLLTQVLSAENKDDDLKYVNKVELVAESNSIGRKMAYSVVGNQNPNKDPQELDASQSTVTILPPFGETLTYIIISIITLAGAALIVAGIVFIKKKVLTK